MDSPTLAETAIERNATDKTTLGQRFMFTGRVLVKRAYEDTPVDNLFDPDTADTVEVVQYTAPEIRAWFRPILRFAMAGFKERSSPQKLLLARALAMNELKDEPEALVIFDREGKKVDV